MVRSIFGEAINLAAVRIRRRKWFPFQPATTTMAPMGHLHFHPRSVSYCDDFSDAELTLQGHFIHEMTHVWQAQQRGKWYLVMMRHPFCRYGYSLKPGWPLARYGLEQQAEIVRHAFLLRSGLTIAGAPGVAAYDALLPFKPQQS